MASGSRDREQVAVTMPMAFLFFDKVATGQDGEPLHQLLEPVTIQVPERVVRERELPRQALIALDGTSTEEGKSAAGVAALRKRLGAELAGPRSYRLENVNPDGSEFPLVPGVYDGLIYLTKPPLPIANLTVVVDGPPPEV
jgi:hypothetical protein